MSSSDDEFEQYLNELNDILSMGAASERVATCMGLDPTNLFENLTWDPLIILFCRDVLTHYKLDPTIFSTPAVPLYTSRDFSHDCLDNLNLPRSIHEVVWLSCIHGWRSSLVLSTFPALQKQFHYPAHILLWFSPSDVFWLTIPLWSAHVWPFIFWWLVNTFLCTLIHKLLIIFV